MFTLDEFDQIPEGTCLTSEINGTRYVKPIQSGEHHTEGMFVSLKTGKIIHCSYVLRKVYKQRKHTTIGSSGNRTDKYPEIDKYLTEIEGLTNAFYPDPNIKAYQEKWSAYFCTKMNEFLSEKGLRVL